MDIVKNNCGASDIFDFSERHSKNIFLWEKNGQDNDASDPPIAPMLPPRNFYSRSIIISPSKEKKIFCVRLRPAQSGWHRFTVSPANGLKMLRFMLSLSCYSPWRRTYVCLQVSPLSVEIKPSPTHDEMLMLMLAGNQQSTRVAGHGKEIGVCIKPGPKARSFTIQRSISQ
jgi:hypothetical protein